MEEPTISGIIPAQISDQDADDAAQGEAQGSDYFADYLEEEEDDLIVEEKVLDNIDDFPEFNEGGSEAEIEPGTSYETHNAPSQLPAEKRKRSESTFDFMISCYKKDFRGQHHDKGRTDTKVIAMECNVFGDSPEEVLEHTWDVVKSHIRREVIVYDVQDMKRVKWADDEEPGVEPNFNDMDKYILFKDLQRKRTYRTSELLEKSDVMVKWRGKVIDVYLHVYSMAVANQKLYDLVKKLEAPDDPDRSGAYSNKSFQGLISELKTMHPEVSADTFVWQNWAEHVESASAYRRDDVKQNPPDDIRSHLRPAPNDDSVVLEENRRGLFFAKTIVNAMTSQIKVIKEQSVQLSTAASQIEERASEMEIQLKSYNDMLTSMQRSLAPVENELSRSLSKSVTDADDVDHML